MSTEKNKALTQRIMEEIWNNGNLDVIDEVFTTDFVHHDPTFPQYCTLEDYKQHILESRTAYPDVEITIDDMIAEGDKVVARLTITGTHAQWRAGGPKGAAGTGKKVTFTAISIIRIAGEKCAETWVIQDTIGNLQQIGAIPPLGGG